MYLLRKFNVINVHLQIDCELTDNMDERETRLFPSSEHKDVRIMCHDVTPEFLIYGTDVSRSYYWYSCIHSSCRLCINTVNMRHDWQGTTMIKAYNSG